MQKISCDCCEKPYELNIFPGYSCAKHGSSTDVPTKRPGDTERTRTPCLHLAGVAWDCESDSFVHDRDYSAAAVSVHTCPPSDANYFGFELVPVQQSSSRLITAQSMSSGSVVMGEMVVHAPAAHFFGRNTVERIQQLHSPSLRTNEQ